MRSEPASQLAAALRGMKSPTGPMGSDSAAAHRTPAFDRGDSTFDRTARRPTPDPAEPVIRAWCPDHEGTCFPRMDAGRHLTVARVLAAEQASRDRTTSTATDSSPPGNVVRLTWSIEHWLSRTRAATHRIGRTVPNPFRRTGTPPIRPVTQARRVIDTKFRHRVARSAQVPLRKPYAVLSARGPEVADSSASFSRRSGRCAR